MLKGQLTLEYLFLALVALALISISLGALLKIRETGERLYRIELFRSSALDLYNAGEELCAMGSGNSMKMKVKENVSVSHDGSEAVFYSQELNFSVSKEARCGYSPAELRAGSEAEVRNERGTIEIS